MKILNFGSINKDYVYSVNEFVNPGETIQTSNLKTFIGGKGLNQSVALAQAGSKVFHAGNINIKDDYIKKELIKWNVNIDYMEEVDESTGHAIIQVNKSGENSIIIHGGANRVFESDQIDKVLENFNQEDILLIQNEINKIPEIIEKAKNRGMTIFFNPAPMTKEVLKYPLSLVDYLILNESEAKKLSKNKIDFDEIIFDLKRKYSNTSVLLTLGEKGSIYSNRNECFKCEAVNVNAVDSTAAGDTFIGYFISCLSKKKEIKDCLLIASKAASICVSKKGGAISIPNHKIVI